MRDLQVGSNVTWPVKIASMATALLGIRGAGKSNLARVLAEEGGKIGGDRGGFFATEGGLRALGDWEPLPTGDGLRSYWLAKVGGGVTRNILQVLLREGRPVAREALAQAAGSSLTSSTFHISLSKLKVLGLITSQQGLVAAHAALL